VTDRQGRVQALAAAQWRLALTLTALMMAIYFGFIVLVAFRKDWLGALVIVSAWVLIWVYVRWANSHYDQTVASLKSERAE
jgi:uncharacterized membrane protein (DUF485 family)